MKHDRASGISVHQAAALLNHSVRWVQFLVSLGFITRAKHGQYSLVEVVRGALAYYENQLEKSTKSAAASRATDARTREIELRMAMRQRELIPIEDVKSVMAEFNAQIRAELTGLPERLTCDPMARRQLEEEVDATLCRLSKQADKLVVALMTGARTGSSHWLAGSAGPSAL